MIFMNFGSSLKGFLIALFVVFSFEWLTVDNSAGLLTFHISCRFYCWIDYSYPIL